MSGGTGGRRGLPPLTDDDDGNAVDDDEENGGGGSSGEEEEEVESPVEVEAAATADARMGRRESAGGRFCGDVNVRLRTERGALNG